MRYIKKTIKGWEVEYGQIALTGNDYQIAKKLFKDLIGSTFTLKTFKGDFTNRNLNDKSDKYSLRLSCGPFFNQLKEGDQIYFSVDENNLKISETEPDLSDTKADLEPSIKKSSISESPNIENALTHILELSRENQKLREINNSLLEYKDRLEKFNRLDYIFEDEKFMEDWLERNIHKALAQLEIIDRQPSIVWSESFIRERPDFFCLDKTTREFVIVENKVRGRNRTVDTQFLKYKAWALENLSAINKKYSALNLNATANLKFVIITDETNDRLEAICRTSSIALILIDGGVLFDPIVPYYN